MTRASIPTLLSLDRYAKIMEINPVHFANAIIKGKDIFPYSDPQCTDRWYQYSWQSPQYVARETLARKIHEVEEEISQYMGYFPAPTWVENEPHMYPVNEWTEGDPMAITLDYGRLIQPGTRALTLVGTPTTAGGQIVFSDADADTFNELATITFPTILTDVNEIKFYVAGHLGDPAWEIRDEISKVITGGNIVARFYVWQLISPILWEAFPITGVQEPIDITLTTNLVTSLDIYREYTDSTQVTATFFFEPPAGLCTVCGGSGCAACSHYEQTGCMVTRNIERGIAIVKPATYDSVDGWVDDAWDVCRKPDIVKVNYQSGDLDRGYLAGINHEPLSDFWAVIIAEMATARLERPPCSCANLKDVWDELRVDLATSGGNINRYVTRFIINCPFGTRRGEVNAWMKLSNFVEKRGKVAVI